jgi:hypothetical protein
VAFDSDREGDLDIFVMSTSDQGTDAVRHWSGDNAEHSSIDVQLAWVPDQPGGVSCRLVSIANGGDGSCPV